MTYLVWFILFVIGAAAIYWLMDWHDKHEDGE